MLPWFALMTTSGCEDSPGLTALGCLAWPSLPRRRNQVLSTAIRRVGACLAHQNAQRQQAPGRNALDSVRLSPGTLAGASRSDFSWANGTGADCQTGLIRDEKTMKEVCGCF